MPNTARRIIGVVALVLAAALVGINFLTTNYRINNPSMGDTLPEGTQIFLKESSEYKPGDIVTIKVGSDVFTHRLLGYKPDGTLITKGDANHEVDGIMLVNGKPRLLTADDIVGKVVFEVRYFMYFLIGWLAALLVTAAWGLLSYKRHRPTHAAS